jgi:signal transduction histidine kinase
MNGDHTQHDNGVAAGEMAEGGAGATAPPSPSRRARWAAIALLMVTITVAHNAIHLASAPFWMTLTQKLYFVPVMLAGFWSGSRGGLATAAVAALLYPHRGHGAHLHSGTFAASQTSDMVLLFIVGGVTGWLRDRLGRELERHRQTAIQRDQALSEATRSYEIARRSERLAALGQMAAGIAHEVRNPLTTMQGAVDILRRSATTHPERVATLLARLESEIGRLGEITHHVLEFARPAEPAIRRLDPHEVAHRCVLLMRPQLESQGLRVELHEDPGALTIEGDPDQLGQVLVNLLLNAGQFAEPGSTIRVASRVSDDAWELAVENRGATIAAADLERIFDPFFTTRAEGTGLGLAIAARIAEAHRGTLRCASAEGTTTFVLNIPRATP